MKQTLFKGIAIAVAPMFILAVSCSQEDDYAEFENNSSKSLAKRRVMQGTETYQYDDIKVTFNFDNVQLPEDTVEKSVSVEAEYDVTIKLDGWGTVTSCTASFTTEPMNPDLVSETVLATFDILRKSFEIKISAGHQYGISSETETVYRYL